jgi:hypothetical protein
LIANGTIRVGIGWAHYPDDAATSKLLLAIAEGRSEKQTGSLTENLLALHSHNRKETETPAAAETPVDLKESSPTRP